MKKIILVILVFGVCNSYSQSANINNEFRSYVLNNCVVCAQILSDSSKLLGLYDRNINANLTYHNCHVFYYRGIADSAYKYALYTLSALKNRRDDKKKVAVNIIEAKILYSKNLLKQSIAEFLKVSEDTLLETNVKPYIYINIGANYADLDDYKSAIPYLEKAVNKYGLPDNNSLRITYNNLGLCYLRLKNMPEAEHYFTRSIEVAKQLKDTLGLAYLYTNIANQYYEQYQDILATQYFTTALKYALLTEDFLIKETAYRNMAAINKNKKDYRSSLMYRELYEEQHDSLYNRDNVWNIAQMKDKLDSQLHAQEIQVSYQENKLQALELDKQKQRVLIAIISSATFLSFFAFALYAYQQKNKQNKIISAQREELNALNHTKDQLFSIVAHDLRSPVQTLRITINKLKTALQHSNISEAEQVSGEIESISNGTYSLLNNLLYWALSQTEQLHFAKEKLNLYRLVEQVYFDYAPVATAKNITLENRVPENMYCSGDMNTIKIILRNLLDNAIKFSEPFTSVMTSGYEKDRECIVSVSDNGNGIDAEVVKALTDASTKRVGSAHGQSTGIGLWLVKTMAERNGGCLKIEPKQKGTEIQIYLPLYRNHEQTANIDC